MEGDHRQAAWKVLLDHVPEREREAVVRVMGEALTLWLGYRDDVADACGIARNAQGEPVRAA